MSLETTTVLLCLGVLLKIALAAAAIVLVCELRVKRQALGLLRDENTELRAIASDLRHERTAYAAILQDQQQHIRMLTERFCGPSAVASPVGYEGSEFEMESGGEAKPAPLEDKGITTEAARRFDEIDQEWREVEEAFERVKKADSMLDGVRDE